MARGGSYEEFVEKFKKKKTTDDCFTPPKVYEAVKDWAIKEYGWQDKVIVRPFYPGNDYKKFSYPDNAAVIDNPPFSIFTDIVHWYLDKGIKFFLFAPTKTFLTCASKGYKPCFVATCAKVTYENGAVVQTSFVSSDGVALRTCPELRERIKQAQGQGKSFPSYDYPGVLMTFGDLNKIAVRGIEYQAGKYEYARMLDAQKPYKKQIYGGGLFVSSEDAIRVKAKIKGAEGKNKILWELSEREKAIVKGLDSGKGAKKDEK